MKRGHNSNVDPNEPCSSSSSKIPAPRRAPTSEKPAADFVNDPELMRALHFSVMKTSEDTLETAKMTSDLSFSEETISSVTSFIWDTVADHWSSDLLTFSGHAGRASVNEEDVLLLMRRNSNLQSLVRDVAGVTSEMSKSRAAKRSRPSIVKQTSKSADSEGTVSASSTPQIVKRASGMVANNIPYVSTPATSKYVARSEVSQDENDKDSFDDDPWDDDSRANEENTTVTATAVTPQAKAVNERKEAEKQSHIFAETINLDDSFDDDDSPGAKTADTAQENRSLWHLSPKPSIGSLIKNSVDDDLDDFSDFE